MTSLEDILALVGELDDRPGEDTPRERFRNHLSHRVKDVGTTRDYIEECLRKSQDQYNRALQDLVNHLGTFLGFQVNPGRYRGVHGQIGFDGHWVSPTGLHIVVEIKTTDAYSIRTSTLLGYINEMVSEQMIPDTDSALGLYVIGRTDSTAASLASSIIAERQTHRLRIVKVQSLLSLADIIKDYDLAHESVLTVVKPSGPTIDPTVSLILDVLAEPKAENEPDIGIAPTPTVPEAHTVSPSPTERSYWITPVATDDTATAEQTIEKLVGRHGIYAFATRTPGRKAIKPGDMICWYAQAKGVVAHATVKTRAVERQHSAVRDPERYRWVFEVADPKLYLENPVVIDGALRESLTVFADRDPNKSWSWFVQATRRVSPEDFGRLTR